MNEREPMDEDDAARLISQEMVGAIDYVYGGDNISAERDRNYEYYRGIMNDLPYAKGQSGIVVPEMANYIGIMKPNLLRIFTAGRNIAEYVSPKPELQDTAKLVTRFINDVVFRKDNRGELLLNDWADDALVQKVGTAMWWWEDKWESKDEILENIPESQLMLQAQDIAARGGEIVEHTETQAGVVGPDGALVSEPIHALKVRLKVNKSKCCIDVIPPEEFVISRDARNLEDGILKAHRTGALVGDLIDAGYDAEIVESLPTFLNTYTDREQKYGETVNSAGGRDTSADPMLRRVAIARGIVRCDYDNTGLKDWYFVVGGFTSSPKILEIAPYNYQVGFADFCPEPKPHTFYGSCPGDRLATIQKVSTVVNRMMLNSLYLHVAPQREVVKDWLYAPDQLANQSAGASVLVKQPGAIREIPIPFVGAAVLEVNNYVAGLAEMTCGVGRSTAGLDPDALQNQSATAAANQYSAMMGRVEMIARVWSYGMRKLFRGVFQCIIAHQDFARVVQIDGEPVSVDPRQWAELDDLDVNINTGLGSGNRDRDLMNLTAIEASQKEVIEILGPQNPVVDVGKVVRTLQLKCEAAGIQNPESFFGNAKNPDGSDWQPPAPEPPQPSPDAVYNADTLDKIEARKADLERQKTIAEIASKERIAREKNYWDAVIAAEKLGIDRGKLFLEAAKVDSQQIANDLKAGDEAA